MFDTLANPAKGEDLKAEKKDRLIRWGAMVVVSVTLFGGLYLVARFLEG
jgi:hypothetical protein